MLLLRLQLEATCLFRWFCFRLFFFGRHDCCFWPGKWTSVVRLLGMSPPIPKVHISKVRFSSDAFWIVEDYVASNNFQQNNSNVCPSQKFRMFFAFNCFWFEMIGYSTILRNFKMHRTSRFLIWVLLGWVNSFRESGNRFARFSRQKQHTWLTKNKLDLNKSSWRLSFNSCDDWGVLAAGRNTSPRLQ